MLKKILKYMAQLLAAAVIVPVMMNLAVVFWGGSYICEKAEVPEGEAILILGAGVWGNSVLSPMLQDRVDLGIELYRAGKTPKLLMSGDHSSQYYDEVTTMKKYARKQGVESVDIFLDHRGFSTYESMVRAREIFGAKKLIIVTQRYHLYRAVFLARVKDFVQVWLPTAELEQKFDLSGNGDMSNEP